MTGLRELLAAATPRPWKAGGGRLIWAGGSDKLVNGNPIGGYTVWRVRDQTDETRANIALIVGLVNCADELLAVAEAARETFTENRDGGWRYKVEPAERLMAALAALDAKTGAA